MILFGGQFPEPAAFTFREVATLQSMKRRQTASYTMAQKII
jgi:hypothetical protein